MRGQLRIDQMYAFIVLDDDNTEGIPAFESRSGTMVPMVGADMAMIERLRPLALRMAREMKKKITLVRFTNREVLEEIE